jgi:hypothetical protein
MSNDMSNTADTGLQVDTSAQEQQVPCKRVIGKPFLPGADSRRNLGGRKQGAPSLKAAAQRCYSRQDVERVARKLLELAAGGDIRAVRLLSELLDDVEPFRASIHNQVQVIGDVQFNIPSNGRPDPYLLETPHKDGPQSL